MDSAEKSKREKALDVLLAVAYGNRAGKDLNFDSLLAAFTPEERAALQDPNKRAALFGTKPSADALWGTGNGDE